MNNGMSNKEWLFYVILLAVILTVIIGVVVYIYVKYANTPVGELPAWLLPFFN